MDDDDKGGGIGVGWKVGEGESLGIVVFGRRRISHGSIAKKNIFPFRKS